MEHQTGVLIPLCGKALRELRQTLRAVTSMAATQMRRLSRSAGAGKRVKPGLLCRQDHPNSLARWSVVGIDMSSEPPAERLEARVVCASFKYRL
jgi:hypothetical protein